MGRCQRSKGTKETTLWLSLGTSWCWEQASQGGIPFHRWASRQSLGSGKLSPGRDSGTLGFKLSVLPTWVPHHPCLPAPVLSGSLQRKQSSQRVLRGYLRFHRTQISMEGGAEPHSTFCYRPMAIPTLLARRKPVLILSWHLLPPRKYVGLETSVSAPI